MTIDTFYERFVPDFKMDTKAVVEYISKLESELYEKNREIEALKGEDYEQKTVTTVRDL
jgi:hypothetical protein